MSHELVMAIRLLKCILIKDEDQSGLEMSELPTNQKFALIKAYSCEVQDHFFAVLAKICGYHEQPHLHTATFAGYNGNFKQ